MTLYRAKSTITFTQRTIIQLRTLGATNFGNNIPDDANLVLENGIWKYPALALTGAIAIPQVAPASVAAGVPQSCAVRLINFLADFGASSSYAIHVKGAAQNTSGEPYPAGSAALYDEGDIIVASGTATQYVSTRFGFSGPEVIVLPGQTLYLTTTAATSGLARFMFEPLR